MKIVVCIPWLVGTDCEWRRRGEKWTSWFWADRGFTVIKGSGVNRSAARNAAANQALQDSAEVLVFADADFYAQAEQVEKTAELAKLSGTFVHGFTWHWRHFRNSAPFATEGEKHNMVLPGGLFAVSGKCWEKVGGFDERFDGWGGEDKSFLYACDTLCGPPERVCGPAFHIWHPNALEAQGRRWDGSRALYKRYHTALDDTTAMKSILSEPGGPLAS